MTNSSDTIDIEVSVDGDKVWSGSRNPETSVDVGENTNAAAVQIDIAFGPDIATLARERLQERKAEGPDLDASLEDALWEYVDVRLSAIEDRPA
jgi:hypothetical protein